jgi:hypothetical protein
MMRMGTDDEEGKDNKQKQTLYLKLNLLLKTQQEENACAYFVLLCNHKNKQTMLTYVVDS